MIYATKKSGEEYFIRDNNLDNDSRVKKGGNVHEIRGNNKEGYTVDNNSKVRINFCTSEANNYKGQDGPSYKHPDFESKGYMFKKSDWKNCEFTVYVKPPKNTITEHDKKDNDITLGLRTGRHASTNRGKCEGFAYKVRINTKKKKWEFRKEQWHESGYAGRGWKKAIVDFRDRWIGYKYIIYNDPNNEEHVKTELWLDEHNNNIWVRKDTDTDDGDWVENGGNEVGREKCDAKRDQIGTWGGPWGLLRWDGPKISFRDVVIREINPNIRLDQD